MLNQTPSAVPSYLETPPSSHVNPPINARAQELPIDQLKWQDFERLCLRLIRKEAAVEHCQQYGVAGQGQEGIDIFARQKLEEKYHVYQCKQVKNFGPTKIKNAVTLFLSGAWVDKTSKFVLCTRENLTQSARAEEFEKQAKILRDKGIVLISWDKDNLSTKLKEYPELVDDFFGRSWVKIFCGDEAAQSLSKRLDREKVIEFRRNFGTFYRNVFNTHDPGLPTSISDGTNVLSLEDRFVLPTICERQTVSLQPIYKADEPGLSKNPQQETRYDKAKYASNDLFLDYKQPSIPEDNLAQENTDSFRRSQNIERWLLSSDRSIVLGGPGSGKSTLLRYIAIDLLQETPTLASLSQKWGQFLPIWIPFAYWTRLLTENPQTSLQDLLYFWLKSWDEERLWELAQQALEDKRLLLLVDGLDEWTNDEALQVAADRLLVFIKQREVPAIITSRPHGFERVNIHETGWQVGELSDFSYNQQKELANIWFSHRLRDCLNILRM